MAYTALYRKFRPLTFSEMVGQDAITQTLKNQIMAGRVGHAYLFNGSRGTGKTSAAKVLARAVNCLHPQNGEPCNECEICKAALNGSLTDIVEMDAASNNSVEDIRSIREEVNFLPTLAKYRVYIIDEVHMLSTGAFNALLKTLEEPPEHVKFILATTEPQKLPATILSRCQRFDFKRISNEDIQKRLQYVCKQSNIEATEGALGIIATLSEGAMRDALSILERCVQDGEQYIDEDKIKDLVGIPKMEMIYQVTKAILEQNTEKALEEIDKMMTDGKDISNILWETTKYLRDILVFQTSKKAGIYSETEKKQIQELSEMASKEKLLNLIKEFSKLDQDIKWSSQKTILFQAGIIRLCQTEEVSGIEELRKEVQKIEERLQQGIVQQVPGQIQKQRKEEREVSGQVKEKKEVIHKTVAGKAEDFWPTILSQLKQEGKIMLYTNLVNTKARKIDDLTIGIEFPNGMTSFGRTVLERPENKNELIKRISIALGKEMRIKWLDQSEVVEKEEESEIENLAKDFDLPINIIDE